MLGLIIESIALDSEPQRGRAQGNMKEEWLTDLG